MKRSLFKSTPRLCSLLARKSPLPLGETVILAILSVILVMAWWH